MGLAPYGKAQYCIDKMRKIISIDKYNALRFKNMIGRLGSDIQPKLKRLLENQRFDNIAAAAQQHLEDLIKKWVEKCSQVHWNSQVGLSRRIFLNVIKESKEVNNIFIYPAPDDGGTPVGASLQAYYEFCIRIE
jgi:carbamoyltransferase